MSDRFYGRRSTYLNSAFNERAGPRTTDDRKYHHTVKPAQRTPHYAQVSELYPMQASLGGPSDFRYRPTADIMMPGTDTPGYGHGRHGSSGGGGVSIPVVHLDSPTYYPSRGTYSGGLSRPEPASSYRTGGLTRKTTPTVTSPTSLSTDPEAEVDALTDALMQKMEAPRSGGIISPHGSEMDGTSSPGKRNCLSYNSLGISLNTLQGLYLRPQFIVLFGTFRRSGRDPFSAMNVILNLMTLPRNPATLV
ncbi:unnamed protein product [Rodentolepis nana]|uniref:Focal adhesion adaptor protein paxillin n=1 Tax=Rodentolepis nana TaxID=102285 RepID=A0A0R3TF29_RODNA|nr:unnamed protein product [Rodentolepis nana]